MVGKNYVPERGDIVWLNFSPIRGHEQGGKRPALVVSRALYNAKTGLCLICPITSRAKGYDFEVALPDMSEIQGVVLSDHVKSLDWKQRRAKKAGQVPRAILLEIRNMLAPLLGIS